MSTSPQEPPEVLALVVHETKPAAALMAEHIETAAAARGLRTVVVEGFRMPEEADVIVGVGGDGTLLHAAQLALRADVPVVGVNLGRVGYLAEIEPAEVDRMLDGLVAGTLQVRVRMTVEAQASGRDPVFGVNDVVLDKVITQRVIQLGVTINGHYFTTYRADGIIVATPVGSTAYSLSAGGPVVDPDLDALILTPVAPHSLLSRSIVLAPSAEVVFRVELDRPVQLNVDGREAYELAEGDEVTVRRGARGVRFLTLGGKPFPQAVRRQFGLDHASPDIVDMEE